MKHWFLLPLIAFSTTVMTVSAEEPKPLRVGIIGLDTSHVLAFTQSLNQGAKNPEDAATFAGVKVVAAYPQGSKDIESSTKRVPEYTEKVKALGVEIVDSIDELLKRVDAVVLESNDGRVHLEQVKPVFAAGKPVFIDKPIAASLADTIRILNDAKKAHVPMFCSSSLRFGKATQAVRNGSIGKVKSAETFSPAHLEPTHPDLFWYGVHGCESLFTVMGTGCQSVKRGVTEDGKIQVTGTWEGGRTGIFREENGQAGSVYGTATRRGYGGKAVGETGEALFGSYDGYDVLLSEIVKMFRTGVVPVSTEETLELYAFMEAADESKRRGGAEVTLKEVLDKARAEVAANP
jgi:predicted dehydrogenase